MSSKTFKPLKASNGNVTGGVLGAKMVSSVPSVKPLISLDFETSVFKKEKVSLAGHDEVRAFFLSIYCLMLILNAAVILCFLSRLRKIRSFFVLFFSGVICCIMLLWLLIVLFCCFV